MRNKIQKGNPMSSVRKNYILRLVIRCLIFLACLTLYLTGKGSFGILEGMNFFQEFITDICSIGNEFKDNYCGRLVYL